MDMLSQFFSMGGYAGFIWPAYGVVAVVLIGLFIAGKRFQTAADAELTSLNPRARRKSETTPGTTRETADET
jgi:heme exporter protein D